MASVTETPRAAGDREALPVADIHLLALRFHSPALEHAFLSQWSQASLWLDRALALVLLAACSNWAAAYLTVWQGLSAGHWGVWPADWQGLWSSVQEWQVSIVHDPQTQCAAVCDFSNWQLLLALLIGITVLCSTCSLVGCSLAMWPNHDVLHHRKFAVQLSWWFAKLYCVSAAITHCSLTFPRVSCAAISWFAAFLAVFTPMYAPLWETALCSMVYCILWFLSLHAVRMVHVSMRQHVTQLLIQALLPIIVQFAVKVGMRVRFVVRYRSSAQSAAASSVSHPLTSGGSSSRSSSLSERRQEGAAHDPQQVQSQQTEWPGAPHPPGASQPTAGPSSASSGVAFEQAVDAGTPTVVVAALPALHDSDSNRASRPQSGPSLIYESPLLHRTIGVKVYSTLGMSRQMVASRLAASVQAALDSLPQGIRVIDQTDHVGPVGLTGPGSSSAAEDPAAPQAVLVNRVLVPGCVMLLGQLVTQQYKSQQHQAPAQQSLQDTSTWLSVEGAWTVQLSGAHVASHGPLEQAGAPFSFQSIHHLEEAVADGSCTSALQAWLDMCAASSPASGGSCSSLQQQSVISGWGRELRLLLAEQQAEAHSGPTGRSLTDADLLVRLVLTQGNEVIMDRQVAVPKTVHTTGSDGSTFAWLLSQQLPHKSITDGIVLDLSAGACALSLHVLSSQPQHTPLNDASSISSDRGSRQLANITILLLAQEAAEEAVAWVQRSNIPQRHLQALLQDMAVALQACKMATAASAAAAATAAIVGRRDGRSRDRAVADAPNVPAGTAVVDDAVHAMKLPASYWGAAMAAALRSKVFLAAHGLDRCSDIMGKCLQELQQVVGRDGIRAADYFTAGRKAGVDATSKAPASDAVIGVVGGRFSDDRNNRLWSP